MPTWEELWDALEPALLGRGIPTMTSGHAKVYAYGKALECLRETFGLDQEQAWGLIRYANNTYQDGPCAIFVTAEGDSLDQLPGFSISGSLPKLEEDE